LFGLTSQNRVLAFRLCNLLSHCCCNLLEKITALILSDFHILPKERNFARTQCCEFLLDSRDILLRLMNLTDDADKFSAYAFTLYGFRQVPEVIKDSLESIGIPLTVGLVHMSHQSSTEFPVCLILGKIGMDTLGSFPEEAL
jgi:hypothetical protein